MNTVEAEQNCRSSVSNTRARVNRQQNGKQARRQTRRS